MQLETLTTRPGGGLGAEKEEVMRNDGEVTCYVLEAKQQSRKDQWFGASLEHFGTPKGFSASDLCWQQTGIMGTFDEAVGLKAMASMSREWPEYDWRLMRLEISQHHFEVATMNAKKPKGKDIQLYGTEHHNRAVAVGR